MQLVSRVRMILLLISFSSWSCSATLAVPSKAIVKSHIERATKAIMKNPNDAEALIERGIAETEIEQFPAALYDLNKGLRLNPQLGSFRAYDARRRALTDAGEWKLAIEDATRAIKLDPKIGWRYKERGQLYQALKQNDLALKDYTTAIDLDPKELWGYMDRGNFYAQMHQYEKAVADFTNAIPFANGNSQPYAARAQMYEKLGQKELARKDREMADKYAQFN
jgi:tetratricopeptide (TPR) repeat protein